MESFRLIVAYKQIPIIGFRSSRSRKRPPLQLQMCPTPAFRFRIQRKGFFQLITSFVEFHEGLSHVFGSECGIRAVRALKESRRALTTHDSSPRLGCVYTISDISAPGGGHVPVLSWVSVGDAPVLHSYTLSCYGVDMQKSLLH